MTAERQSLGKQAEQIAADQLSAAGWRILARNARTRYGEIDIVAFEEGTLVFVEVKAGRSGRLGGPERPAFAVGHRKQLRIRSLAAAYLASQPPLPRFARIRFDVIGLTLDRQDRVVHTEHIRRAF